MLEFWNFREIWTKRQAVKSAHKHEPASSISIFHKQETMKHTKIDTYETLFNTSHCKYRHCIAVKSPVIYTSDLALQSSKEPKIASVNGP